MPERSYLSQKEAAAILGISIRTISRNREDFHPRRVGRRVLIPVSSVLPNSNEKSPGEAIEQTMEEENVHR
jgi:hypothetical protein